MYPKYEPREMTRKELVALVEAIDNHAPRADETTDESGITLGEAVWRMMYDARINQAVEHVAPTGGAKV